MPDHQPLVVLGFLIGATPALMALMPWDFGTEMFNYRAFILAISLVVPLVEIICIL
jgi:hypothetical protein